MIVDGLNLNIGDLAFEEIGIKWVSWNEGSFLYAAFRFTFETVVRLFVSILSELF